MIRWFRNLLRRKQAPVSELLLGTLTTLSDRLKSAEIDHALIGGIAVVLHGPPRFTNDIDFMLPLEDATKADEIMRAAGFEPMQRTDRFGNYRIGLLHVDFLFAGGQEMRGMLARAKHAELENRRIKVLLPEDLVGLKLQALANVPNRKNDEADVTMLIERFYDVMDQDRLRRYFVLFNKEHELEAILRRRTK